MFTNVVYHPMFWSKQKSGNPCIYIFFSKMYDGSSVKEKISKKKFHHRILGGENIFKYIFTPVYWGKKIYLNLFSTPYFWGRKYI